MHTGHRTGQRQIRCGHGVLILSVGLNRLGSRFDGHGLAEFRAEAMGLLFQMDTSDQNLAVPLVVPDDFVPDRDHTLAFGREFGAIDHVTAAVQR